MIQGIKKSDIKDFEEYAQKLANVVVRIREYKPEANAFLGMDYMYLMSDDFHEGNGVMNQDFIVTSVYMPNFDGGAW